MLFLLPLSLFFDLTLSRRVSLELDDSLPAVESPCVFEVADECAVVIVGDVSCFWCCGAPVFLTNLVVVGVDEVGGGRDLVVDIDGVTTRRGPLILMYLIFNNNDT